MKKSQGVSATKLSVSTAFDAGLPKAANLQTTSAVTRASAEDEAVSQAALEAIQVKASADLSSINTAWLQREPVPFKNVMSILTGTRK